MSFNRRYRIAFLLCLAIEIFIGLFVRDNFVRPFLGDVLVVILVYCFIKTFLKKKRGLLPLYIFLFACAVEASQYFDLVNVLGLGGGSLAGVIVGATFDIYDLLCYLAGFIALLLWHRFFEDKLGGAGPSGAEAGAPQPGAEQDGGESKP
jgi:hypothetical protein